MTLGEANTLEEAAAQQAAERIDIVAGTECAHSLSHQAALLTAVATACRVVGTVVVAISTNTLEAPVLAGAFVGQQIQSALSAMGAATSVKAGTQGALTISVGSNDGIRTSSFLTATWEGWTGAVYQSGARMAEDGIFPLSAITAAALAVSEAFLRLRRVPDAGLRDVQLSLWEPWSSTANPGPTLEYLPRAWWLVGLGHLGQAYSWSLGWLPYDPDNKPAPLLVVQDIDVVTQATLSTGILSSAADKGCMKTRMVAKRMDASGFDVRIVERRMSQRVRIEPDEPRVALVGVDNVATRLDLSKVGWNLCVDGGLGAGPRDYTSISMHSFPGPRRSEEVSSWKYASPADPEQLLDEPAFQDLEHRTGDRCGVLELAGRSVATTFVGVMAACLVVSEPIRRLHGGSAIASLSLDLKDPRRVVLAPGGDAKQIPHTAIGVKGSP
jgi:hypothetical protein